MTSKRGRRARAAAADAAAAVGATAPDAAAGRAGSPVTGGSASLDAVIADATELSLLAGDSAVVRRTKDGWRVGSDDLPDLTCAMVLADLLAAENGTSAAPRPKPGDQCDQGVPGGEAGKLRATISQLEHALATRIRVEQAIGVLAERHRIKPREAFEQLRDAARSRGRKVIDIAGDVVASATNPLLQLPDELSRPRSGARRGMHQPTGA